MDRSPDNNHDKEPSRLTDADRLTQAVESAQLDGNPIPHEAARVIAALLHDGPALVLLARTGGVDLDGLNDELQPVYYDEQTSPEVRAWIDALRDYVASRDDYGPVKGWGELWVSPAYGDDDCCTSCGEHLSYPHAPTCPRLVAEPPEHEPGLQDDLMGLLNKDAGTLFDMSERRRIAEAVEAYIRANYVAMDEAVVMNTDVRLEELTGMNGVTKELLQDDEAHTQVALRMIGHMAMHVDARLQAIRRITDRKPD